jgi:hypothetical protein
MVTLLGAERVFEVISGHVDVSPRTGRQRAGVAGAPVDCTPAVQQQQLRASASPASQTASCGLHAFSSVLCAHCQPLLHLFLNLISSSSPGKRSRSPGRPCSAFPQYHWALCNVCLPCCLLSACAHCFFLLVCYCCCWSSSPPGQPSCRPPTTLAGIQSLPDEFYLHADVTTEAPGHEPGTHRWAPTASVAVAP